MRWTEGFLAQSLSTIGSMLDVEDLANTDDEMGN